MKIQKLLLCLLALALVAAFAVPMVFAAEEDINLMYDDRKELSSLVDATGDVVISNEVVTSNQVGSTTKDEHVLVYQDGVLYAVGTGTATLTVGEKSYNVTVSPAPISLFMITGHSIGAGQEGNGTQSVVVEAGQAYSSYHQNSLDVTQVDGYGLGWGSENRVGVSGVMRWDSYGQLDSFAPGEGGNTGSGSGFAYRWNQLTGEKVWVINIAIGGSCINEWLPGTTGHNTSYDRDYYSQTISKFTYAQTILKNEVAAGHYTLSKQGILNFPGYNFSWYSGWSVESLQEDYEILWNAYTEELTKVDIDGDGINDGLDIMSFTVAWANGTNAYDRPVAWYMGTSKDYPMVVASAATLQWRDDLSTFPAIDYTTQSVAPYMPDSQKHIDQGGTSANSLLCAADTTHYSQVGYNAIGLDMGANLAAYFAEKSVATNVRLEDYSSVEIPNTVDVTVGETFRLTPVVTPVTVDDLTYEVTGAAELTYPLAVKATEVGTATLTVKQGENVLKTVTFNVSAAHTHCVCGGTLTGAAAEYHTCSEAITYVPLTKDCYTNWRYTEDDGSSASVSTVLREGNYYLDGDFTASTIYIAPGQTVNICLNGYKLTSTGRTFSPNGNLNICDCSEDGSGEVYSKRAGTSPVLYGYSGSVINIYGGTYSSVNPLKREYGGCMAVAADLGLQNCDPDGDGDLDNTTKFGAVLNIWGGKLIGSDLDCTDGSVAGNGAGGCLYVTKEGTLNIYGGEFTGGSCVPYEDGGTGGGGIISNTGVCNIYGGKFTGSTDPIGAIWANSSKTFISGNPEFTNNNHADIFLHYCDHFYIGEAGISVETPIRVAGSADSWTQIHLTKETDAAAFVGVHGLTMNQPDSDLIMTFSTDRTYCYCGGTMSEEMKQQTGHVCQEGSWTTLNNGNMATRFSTSSSKYILKSDEVWLYLSSNVNLGYPIEVKSGKTLHIDLNGYTLTHSNGSNALFRVYGNLTICDSKGGGEVIGVRTGTNEASALYMLNKSGDIGYTPQVDLYSGTMTGFNVTSKTDRTPTVAKQAGVIQIGNNAINKDSVFNMYGGTITGGIAGANGGGNVYLGHGRMNMYGGVIENGTSTSTSGYGGNVRVGGSNYFTMYGGTIRNGTAQNGAGGNIYISAGTNALLGGTIENGLSAGNGGNLYLGGGGLTVSNMTFSGGGATQGGNMYLYKGTLVMSDTLLTGGTAGYTYTRNADGTLSVSTKNAASGNAGNLYVNNVTATLTDCTLENGISYGKGGSNGFGGNCYNRGSLTMDGCTITGGQGFRGGVVGIRDNGDAASYTELKNCTFYNNKASVGGSSLSIWANDKGSELVIENCTFDDSMNETRRGVLQLTNQDCTAVVTATLKDITVNNNNPNDDESFALYGDYGTFVLQGNCVLNADDADIYLIEKARLAADDFTPAEPVTICCEYVGQFGTSATDKSACFASATHGITWKEGILYCNGLLKGAAETYAAFADAIAAEETALTLLADHAGDAALTGDLYLDLNGFELTGNITGGTLYGLDSATNDYTAENAGRIIGTVENVAKQFKNADGKRYLAVADENGYSFHRFFLGITHANLKPSAKGVGYKAVFAGSDVVKAHVDGVGYSLQLEGNDPVTRQLETFTSMTPVTLRVENYDAENWGTKGLTAQVYMVIDGETVYSTACTYSLQQLVETVNEKFASYSEDQLAAIAAWIAQSEVMKSWKTENLCKA